MSIRKEVGKDVLVLLVDVSKKKQMTIVLRYVDSLGIVKEIYIGI